MQVFCILDLVITLWYIFGKHIASKLLHILSNHATVFKNFNKNEFLRDLNVKPWHEVNSQINPSCMWNITKTRTMACIGKHKPVRRKRVGKKKAPWMTNELQNKMHVRNRLRKQAVNLSDGVSWDKYKRART